MKLFLSILFALFCVTACVKKSSQQSSQSVSVTTTGSNPSSSNLYYGFFPLERYEQWYNGSIAGSPTYACKMQLYNSPVSNYATWQAVNLGTVTVNGTTLKYNSSIKLYMDTTGTADYSTQRLIALNSASLPSFTTTVTDTFPAYNSLNAAQINDTLFLNANFTVPMNGIHNYDVVSAQITTVPGPVMGPIVSKNGNAPVSQLVFSPSDLGVFSSGQQLYLRLVLKKYSTKTYSGINYRFECLSYNDFYFRAQ